MDLSSVHNGSTPSLLGTVIFFWFLGGSYLANGIQRLEQNSLACRWSGSFLSSLAYLGAGISKYRPPSAPHPRR